MPPEPTTVDPPQDPVTTTIAGPQVVDEDQVDQPDSTGDPALEGDWRIRVARWPDPQREQFIRDHEEWFQDQPTETRTSDESGEQTEPLITDVGHFEPLRSTDPVAPGDPTYEFTQRVARGKLQPLRAQYKRGLYAGLVDEDRLAFLLNNVEVNPDSPDVQSAHFMLDKAAARLKAREVAQTALTLPSTNVRRLGDGSVRVTQSDSVPGREPVVSTFSAQEIAAGLAAEQEEAGKIPDPQTITLEEAARLDAGTRRRMIAKDPAAWDRLLEAASRQAME